MLCYAKLKDRNAFVEWLKESGWKRKNNFHSSLNDGGWYNDNWQNYFYHKQDVFNDRLIDNIFKGDSVETLENNRCTAKFLKMLDYLNEIKQRMHVYYRDDFACIAGYGNQRYIMPTEQLEFIELVDYGKLTQTELKKLGGTIGGDNLPANINEKSQDVLKDELDIQEELLNKLNQEKKDIQSGATTELQKLKLEMERIKSELEAKQQALLAELKIKQEELELKKKELEKEIFLLETQIYGIRCYLGEVIDFYKILEGSRAPIDEPVVLYQKIRYLDEELGKAASIYDFEGLDCEKHTFLELLKYRKDIRELFVPNTRCISVLRVSRTGIYTAASEKFANTLASFEMYHGKQLAILLRNGDEVYITWLDEEKITIRDENVFYSPTVKPTEKPYEDEASVRTSGKKEIASRYFLVSILQGVVDSGKLIDFPEKINFLKPCQKYIIFSMADGWITNRKYGDFDGILGRIKDIPFKEGDMVLTGLQISRDDHYSFNGYRRRDERFSNNRGIGEKNRTHDASIPAFKIVPVNKVLFDLTIQYEYEKIKVIGTKKEHSYIGGGGTYTTIDYSKTDEVIGTDSSQCTLDYDTINTYKRDNILTNKLTEKCLFRLISNYTQLDTRYCFIDKNGNERDVTYCSAEIEEIADAVIYGKRLVSVSVYNIEYHYFLSALKGDSHWRDTESRANMEFYRGEVIPLTYLCPTWIKYVITTGNIGNWQLGGEYISYAQSLKYLNRILQHLKELQTEEQKMLTDAGLGDWIAKNPEWDVSVVEWRIENGIRKMTPYQAKRFSKSIQN